MFEPAQSARHYVAAVSSLSSGALDGHHCQPSASLAPPGGCWRASSRGVAQGQARREPPGQRWWTPWALATPGATWRLSPAERTIWPFPFARAKFTHFLERVIHLPSKGHVIFFKITAMSSETRPDCRTVQRFHLYMSRTDQYFPHLCCHCMHLPWGTVVALLLLPAPFA